MSLIHLKPVTDHLTAHNNKVQFLDMLAILLGCKASLGCALPDGNHPDVLRIDLKKGVLFIGEGKNTESPQCLDTQIRLIKYLRWLSTHVSIDGRVGIFAICFERESDSSGWIKTINLLTHEIALYCSECGVQRFGLGLNVVWFLFKGSDF